MTANFQIESALLDGLTLDDHDYNLFGQFKTIKNLGRGTYGTVSEVIWKEDADCGIKRTVAIKIMNRLDDAKYERAAYNRLAALDPDNKTCCIQLLYSNVAENSRSYLVFPKLGESLEDFQYNNGIFSLNQIRHIGFQLLSALTFLHRNKIVHRDLKGDNILLVDSDSYQEDEDSDRILKKSDIKIIDFGMYLDTRSHPTDTQLVQTKPYRAPEVYLGLGYSQKIDVWSVGAILFGLFVEQDLLMHDFEDVENLAIMERVLGKIPSRLIERSPVKAEMFDQAGNVKVNTILRQKIQSEWKLLDDYAPNTREAKQLFWLIKQLWKLDPRNRITAKHALQHPFFASNK